MFTVINPALLPAAAGDGSKSRIEFVWDSTYDYSNTTVDRTPKNEWRTDVVSLNKVRAYDRDDIGIPCAVVAAVACSSSRVADVAMYAINAKLRALAELCC
jgi:hypothetical protein